MIVNLVKIKKYLIYFFLFLFFNCILNSSLNANPQFRARLAIPEPDIRGIEFNNDGSKMFTAGTGGGHDIDEYSLTTPYDITTAGTPDDSLTVGSFVQGIRFNDDGTKMFLMPNSDGNIREIHLGTAFDISSQTNLADPPVLGFGVGGLSNSSQNAISIEFNSDGTKLFVLDPAADEIDEYTLSTGFDIESTVSYVQSLSIGSEETNPTSIAFDPTGTTLFVVGQQNDRVHEYVLTTGFDLSTATVVNDSNGDAIFFHTDQSRSKGGPHPKTIIFNDDGTKMYIGETGQDEINEYTLPGAYNLKLPTVTISPADNATSVALDANIVLSFSEPMDVEEGNITIKKTSGDTLVEEIDVTSSQVTGTGTATITINPSSDLEENTEYYVLIDSTAFDDGSDASYAGITSTTALSFTTANSAPTLVSSVPADDATDVAIDANIVLNFSESVNADDGDIVIYKTSGGTTVETIASTASNVTGSGTSQITINPSADFEYGVEYYVLIDSGAFDDANDEDYTGITSTTALSFTVNNRVDPTTIKDVVGSIDAQSELAKNYISQSIDIISNRLRYLRQNRLNDSLSSQDLQIDVGNTILTSLANDNLQKNTNSIMPNNWSTWSAGSINLLKIGDSTNSSLQETEGKAVALGFDKKLNDSDFFGFAIQYGQSDSDIGSNGTSVDSENINFSIYRARPLDDNNFIETFFGVGLIESDLKRIHNSNILTGSRDGTQIFGSINYGKTIDRGDFNLTPIGRLDLGLTELDDYTETGTDALFYSKQRIESGKASFGFEFNDNIALKDNILRPFGSLNFINDFSNKSEAKMNYVADPSTIYTYTQQTNSSHLISSMIGLTYIAGDYLNINSSYRRTQGNKSENHDTINFAINFTSNRETQFTMSLAGDENTDLKVGISKNIYGFDLGFSASEYFSANPNQEAELILKYNF